MFKYYRVIRIIEVQKRRSIHYYVITRNELQRACVRICMCMCIYYAKENGHDFKTYIRDISNATVEGILYV